MKIDLSEDEFQALSSHLHTRFKDLPPAPVYLVLMSLVPKPADITASLRFYMPGEATTVWRVHLLTRSALAVADVKFQAELYTRREEDRYRPPSSASPPDFEVREAWVRPLDSIVEYSVSLGGVILGRDWFAVSAKVKFRDLGEPVELPAQSFTDDAEDQERSDKFLLTLRESIPWLA